MNLKIVSVKKVEKESDDVKEVLLPTSSGVIKILPEHQSLITKLNVGEIVIRTEGPEERILLSGGFAKVDNNKVLILADEADMPDSLVREQLRESIKNAEKTISSGSLSASELIQLEKQLMYERFKLGYISQS
jgi:F-type H+-transporting ATPase subunit epsilon